MTGDERETLKDAGRGAEGADAKEIHDDGG